MSAARPLANLGSNGSGNRQAGFPLSDGRAQRGERGDQPENPCASATPIPIGRRAAARLRLALPARLITLYGSSRCILIDMSSTGAQVGLETPLATNESVILEIAGKELFCDVVRVARGPQGGTNGLVFDPPLEDQEVLDVRRFAETYESNEVQALRSEVRAWVEGLV